MNVNSGTIFFKLFQAIAAKNSELFFYHDLNASIRRVLDRVLCGGGKKILIVTLDVPCLR